MNLPQYDTQLIHNKFLTFLSPAKLNLGLKIIGKRSDGYHLLHTTFCLIDLFDEISIQATNNGRISLLDHNQAWFYQKDLAYKAAIHLQNYTKTQLGCNIKIKKTIPSGSGLGGGSSDAATVLIALNQLWQTNLTQSELIDLGRRLGADVPFFIYGKNAIANGIGDVFTEIDIPEQYFVLIIPPFHLATNDVFTAFAKLYDAEQLADQRTTTTNQETKQNNIAKQIFKNSSTDDLKNDLQGAAIFLKPELGDMITKLRQYGCVSMTGSGSAIYLTYFDKNIAKKVAKELTSSYNTFLVSRLTQSPLYSGF
jgi:4-diphosphocytidyl-2-C-methyl-D-erythritol kinase